MARASVRPEGLTAEEEQEVRIALLSWKDFNPGTPEQLEKRAQRAQHRREEKQQRWQRAQQRREEKQQREQQWREEREQRAQQWREAREQREQQWQQEQEQREQQKWMQVQENRRLQVALEAEVQLQRQQRKQEREQQLDDCGAGLLRIRAKRAQAPAVLHPETAVHPSSATKFRQRQQATISSLEAELNDKLAQLQVLSAENELLKLRSTMLEAAVKGHAYHIQVIQEYGPPLFEQHKQQTVAAAAATAAVAALRSGRPLLAATVAEDECDGVRQEAIRCIKRMSADNILALWRQFLNDVTSDVLAAEDEEEQQQAAGDGDSGGGCSSGSWVRMAALVDTYAFFVKFLAMLNPGALYHLLGRNLDTGAAEPYSDMHWRGVLAQLALTPSQNTQLLACGELYFGSLARLWAERATLQAALRAADEGVNGVSNQLVLLDLNLKREHALRIMLNCFVDGCFSSIQFAKAAVYSHPFFPDVHAMVCILYEDAARLSPGGQPTLMFSTAAATASHEQQVSWTCSQVLGGLS